MGSLSKGPTIVLMTERAEGTEFIFISVTGVFTIKGQPFGQEIGRVMEPGVERLGQDGGR